jgi:glycerate-2-kinase
VAGGAIATKDGHLAPVQRVALRECSHPVPDERGVAAAAEISQNRAQRGRRGPGHLLSVRRASALLPLPADGITLSDKQETTRLLLASGANIHEINAVRKHLVGNQRRTARGGRLSGARVVAHPQRGDRQ